MCSLFRREKEPWSSAVSISPPAAAFEFLAAAAWTRVVTPDLVHLGRRRGLAGSGRLRKVSESIQGQSFGAEVIGMLDLDRLRQPFNRNPRVRGFSAGPFSFDLHVDRFGFAGAPGFLVQAR